MNLYDIQGRVVKQKQISQNPTIIERNNLVSGLYILILSDNNHNVYAKVKVAVK
jgi:hypothetical protein